MQAATGNGARVLDLKGCAIPPKSNLKVDSGDAYDYIGQLRIAQDGTTECLSEQIGNTSDTISASPSDGGIVSRSTSDEGKTSSHRDTGADGATTVSLSEKPVLNTHGDHLVYSTVAAFSEKDLKPPGA